MQANSFTCLFALFRCVKAIDWDANFYPWMGGGNSMNIYLPKNFFFISSLLCFFRDTTVVQASQDLSFTVAVPATLTSSLEQVRDSAFIEPAT